MKTTELVWAFDLGKASIGEAVRRGNEFLAAALKSKTGMGATPAGFVLRNAFDPMCHAWRTGKRFALSNFVLIPPR